MKRIHLIVFATTWILGMSSPTSASPAENGKKLVTLRTEVDELQSRLDQIRSTSRMKRISLETQKGDLEVMLSKEQVRQKTMRRIRAKQLAEQHAAETESTKLVQPALDAANLYRQFVLKSLPFKRDERLAAVDEIIGGLEAPRPDPEVALSRLWQLIEDELKLTQESGLHKQVIELEGKNVLVEVAHLGMGVLYFKTTDNRYGWAVEQQKGRYDFVVFTSEERTQAIETLFTSLRKQIRKGYFQVLLPSVAGKPVMGMSDEQ